MNTRIRFYVITVILLLLTVFCGAAPTTESEVQPNAYVITKCRQKCFSKLLNEFKFNGNLMQYLRCRSTPNCYMCWDYCRAVSLAQVDLARCMCNDNKFCLKGCKVACNFHRIKMI